MHLLAVSISLADACPLRQRNKRKLSISLRVAGDYEIAFLLIENCVIITNLGLLFSTSRLAEISP
jgi:hypothetical protein